MTLTPIEPFCTSTLNRVDDVNIAKPLTQMEPVCTNISSQWNKRPNIAILFTRITLPRWIR